MWYTVDGICGILRGVYDILWRVHVIYCGVWLCGGARARGGGGGERAGRPASRPAGHRQCAL